MEASNRWKRHASLRFVPSWTWDFVKRWCCCIPILSSTSAKYTGQDCSAQQADTRLSRTRIRKYPLKSTSIRQYDGSTGSQQKPLGGSERWGPRAGAGELAGSDQITVFTTLRGCAVLHAGSYLTRQYLIENEGMSPNDKDQNSYSPMCVPLCCSGHVPKPASLFCIPASRNPLNEHRYPLGSQQMGADTAVGTQQPPTPTSTSSPTSSQSAATSISLTTMAIHPCS